MPQKKQDKRAGKGKVDTIFLILVLSLLTLGLVMLFSASYAYCYYRFGNSFAYITKQAIFAAAGVVAMLLISKFDYHILKKFSYIFFGFSLIMMVVVLFMDPINDAKRWIIIGGQTFQPSELMKFSVIVLFSYWISKDFSRMKTFRYGVLPFMAVLGVVAVLLVLQPHLSATILILTIGLFMMIIGGTSGKWFVLGGSLITAGLFYVVMFTNFIQYASSRLSTWMNPFSDPQGKGFQTIQSLLSIGSGGLMGLGLGNSRQKYLYIPEPHNDFIFSVVCEELGFIGASIIIILFMLLVWRGFIIAMRAPDKFGAMLVIGLILQVGVQTILNIAVVTNTIPNTGISLPFFSYGGTALLMLLSQMGIILSVSRNAALEKMR